MAAMVSELLLWLNVGFYDLQLLIKTVVGVFPFVLLGRFCPCPSPVKCKSCNKEALLHFAARWPQKTSMYNMN